MLDLGRCYTLRYITYLHFSACVLCATHASSCKGVFGLATPFHCHTVHVDRLVCTARFHIAALRSRFAGMLYESRTVAPLLGMHWRAGLAFD